MALGQFPDGLQAAEARALPEPAEKNWGPLEEALPGLEQLEEREAVEQQEAAAAGRREG